MSCGGTADSAGVPIPRENTSYLSTPNSLAISAGWHAVGDAGTGVFSVFKFQMFASTSNTGACRRFLDGRWRATEPQAMTTQHLFANRHATSDSFGDCYGVSTCELLACQSRSLRSAPRARVPACLLLPTSLIARNPVRLIVPPTSADAPTTRWGASCAARSSESRGDQPTGFFDGTRDMPQAYSVHDDAGYD